MNVTATARGAIPSALAGSTQIVAGSTIAPHGLRPRSIAPQNENGVVPFQINLHPAVARRLRGLMPGAASASSRATPAAGDGIDAAPKKRFSLDIPSHPKARKIAMIAGLIGVVGVGTEAGRHIYLQSARNTLDPVIDDSVKVAKLSNSLTQYRARRDSVYAMAFRVQLMDVHRHVWPHLLDEISAALPTSTWMLAVNQGTNGASAAADSTVLSKDPEIEIEAMRALPEDLPVFMQNLEHSPWIRAVVLKEAREDMIGTTPVQRVTLRIVAKRDTSNTSPLNQSSAPPLPPSAGKKSRGATPRLVQETK